MKQLSGLDVTLHDQLLLNKEQQNMDYLMELESDALLQILRKRPAVIKILEAKNSSMAAGKIPPVSCVATFLVTG